MYMHTPGHAKHLSAADKANDLCDMAKLNGSYQKVMDSKP